MKRKNGILSCAILFLMTTLPAFGQKIETDLKNKRITIKTEKVTLRKIFRVLMTDYKIPIGFEKSTLDNNHDDFDFDANPSTEGKKDSVKTDGTRDAKSFDVKKHLISLNFKNARLKNVLDGIVRQMKNYNWEINEGVVNIFPIRGRDQRCRRLLMTKIRNFTFKAGTKLLFIRLYISDLSEFKEFLSKTGLVLESTRLGFGRVLGQVISGDLNFSNLTFRELLNKITKTKGGGWILKRGNYKSIDEKEYIEIDI